MCFMHASLQALYDKAYLKNNLALLNSTLFIIQPIWDIKKVFKVPQDPI